MWRFIRDVASGLAYLHSMNPPIIHQDIKPDNILILRNGDFVITDFGISKQYHAVKASDIWSLGASIFELATEELPFCGMGGSLLKQGADMPELPEQYSRTLNMICQSCMTKETWNRPTAQQLADFASKYMEGETPKITWKIDQSIEIPANILVDNQSKPTAMQPAESDANTVAKPSTAELKSTMAHAAEFMMDNNKTVAFTPSVSEPVAKMQPAPEAKFAIKSDKREQSIAAWVWIVVALAGLISGFVLNLVM